MLVALAIIAVALVTGIAFVRGYRAPGAASRSKGGWYGLGLLALLFCGLFLSGRSRNEALVYSFGFALVLAVLVMALTGISSAFGRFAGKQRQERSNSWQAPPTPSIA